MLMRIIAMKKVVAFLLLVSVLGTGPAWANPNNSCWGEATAIFAQLGEMGEHSSAQAESLLNPPLVRWRISSRPNWAWFWIGA
jgi:hypothetical protein